MSKPLTTLCGFCEKEPATTGGLWLGPGLAVSLCRACLATCIAYDYLLDALGKKRFCPQELTPTATGLLKDMRDRIGLNIAPLAQEVGAFGVKIDDMPKAGN